MYFADAVKRINIKQLHDRTLNLLNNFPAYGLVHRGGASFILHSSAPIFSSSCLIPAVAIPLIFRRRSLQISLNPIGIHTVVFTHGPAGSSIFGRAISAPVYAVFRHSYYTANEL